MEVSKLITTAICVIMSLTSTAACGEPEETSNLTSSTPNKTQQNPTPTTPAPKDSAVEFAQNLGIGWNLGNNLDAWNSSTGVAEETNWGNGKATQATFNAVKAAGYRSVRIPITWTGHIGAAPEYNISTTRMNRVAEVVEYAHKAGLYVIINIHHDGHADTFNGSGQPDKFAWLKIEAAAKDESVNDAIKQQLAKMWTQIAERFKNEGNWLIFETLNEIHDGNWGNESLMYNPSKQYAVLNEWNQIALNAIRATGGNNATRYVGIPGYVCLPGLTAKNLKLPTDTAKGKLMVAVHSYDPWDYAGSGKYAQWGHTGNVDAYKNGEIEYVAMLDMLYNKFVVNDIPVYFGEFACVHRTDPKAEEFRKYYLEYVCKAMKDRKMVGMYWDNGYETNGKGTDDDVFGLINHNTGAFILDGKEISKIMVNAWENTSSSYTLQSIYNRAPKP